jgi:hypothetical protein
MDDTITQYRELFKVLKPFENRLQVEKMKQFVPCLATVYPIKELGHVHDGAPVTRVDVDHICKSAAIGDSHFRLCVRFPPRPSLTLSLSPSHSFSFFLSFFLTLILTLSYECNGSTEGSEIFF